MTVPSDVELPSRARARAGGIEIPAQRAVENAHAEQTDG